MIGNSVPENCSKVMGPFDARFGHDVGRDRAHVIKQDPPASSFREKQMHPAGVRTGGVTGGLQSFSSHITAGQG